MTDKKANKGIAQQLMIEWRKAAEKRFKNGDVVNKYGMIFKGS